MESNPLPHPVVELHALRKVYTEGGRERVVLDNVDYRFNAGEFVVLLGHSGSGKSTLLNLISGIDRPDGGDVSILGTTITRLSERDRTLFRRDHVGFIFQFFNLIPTLSVLENVTLPQELAGRRRKEIEPPAIGLLARVGLADRRDTFPDKLSGGEQQRVAIARALAHDPLLVLADEPTGNLDDVNGERVLALLLELTRDAGRTLLMATHNPDIAPLADRVLQVHEGRLVSLAVGHPSH
ncbi:putative transporter subunit: ATP-binding component of ABC superfamily [Candidatus Promineifilum breve]|uniref:Transporter subunit: ATP-binding component of ABC superfamily n=1 Tax=Candidatus Promineifilum breve TaxID=1806508 RepID=A0A170PG28_9CHLR|nr:ABC transporter ATP-binding protein [Candidatus Promineifilum breve]CUS03513.2 putative transporter subunit: ATP-binding component of ABC superfamily [Candidatus Promineifilum breve]